MSSLVTQSSLQSTASNGTNRAQILMWISASAFVLVVIGMIVGAPLATSLGYPTVGAIIFKVFAPLCHQISERSFHLDGHPFAVCSRCTGIYAGFAAGVVFYPLVRSLKYTYTPRRLWLLLSAVPIAVDWLLGFSGIWANTHFSRFLTGALLGTVCALYIVPGLIDMLGIDWRHFWGNSKGSQVHNQAKAMPAPHSVSAPSDYSSPANRI